MSFTRFSYDEARVRKDLQQSTDPGRYMLNVPGPADNTKYIESPFIRLQGFADNIRTNSTNIESDLKGLTRNLNRDSVDNNDYKQKEVHSKKINYNEDKSIWTDQSRTTHPAWTYKDLTQQRNEYLFFNPQDHTSLPFQNSLSTRILEKDYFKQKSFNTSFN